jgi:hypothetical protein
MYTRGQAATVDFAEAERPVREQCAVIETADLALAEATVSHDCVNHRAGHEPLAARQCGPLALHVTARWLPDAFSDLRFADRSHRRARRHRDRLDEAARSADR